MADRASLVDALTSQQQAVLSGSVGNPVLRFGVLPRFPVFGAKYTSGFGVDIEIGGASGSASNPIIRIGQILWTGGPGGTYLQINGMMLLDNAGNPRLICDYQGMAEFNNAGTFTGWLFGPF
jgi:hypothetical protein